ncbi:HAD-IC family P-type ATPase [Mycoplasma sp. SG1]|uniref:HAD-IC family P-type ATPase n=1 Tax=Mycoplasma sp. SG1 TaxID=2810348 RepID=UPI0020247F60|nr:HAD-IC family P-type ATPase [Mycoplasma sp. SG1]URM53200.1 HAD-IC family P-type ATPase [Mycoplasma sp. SG1]
MLDLKDIKTKSDVSNHASDDTKELNLPQLSQSTEEVISDSDKDHCDMCSEDSDTENEGLHDNHDDDHSHHHGHCAINPSDTAKYGAFRTRISKIVQFYDKYRNKFLLVCLPFFLWFMFDFIFLIVNNFIDKKHFNNIIFNYFILDWISIFVIFCFLLIPIILKLFLTKKGEQFSINNIIAVSSLLLIIYSIVNYITHFNEPPKHTSVIFFSAGILVFLFVFGEYLEDVVFKQTNNFSKKIKEIIPKEAKLLFNNKINNVPVETLKLNDIVVVHTNEMVPCDGYIISEQPTILNTKLWTGDVFPKSAKKNEYIASGDINLGPEIQIRVTKSYKDFSLTYFLNSVSSFSKPKGSLNKLANKIGKKLSYIILIFGALTFIGWVVYGFIAKTGDVGVGQIFVNAFIITISVLVAFCPCAFGITIPLISVISANKARLHNILINNQELISKVSKLTTIVFDKTGTLTKNEIMVHNLNVFGNNQKYLSYLKALELESSHPLAHALLNNMLQVKTAKLKDRKEKLGIGVFGTTTNDEKISVTSYKYATENFPNLKTNQIQNKIVMVLDNQIVVGFDFDLLYRDETWDALEKLKAQNYNLYIITGDDRIYDKKINYYINPNNIFTKIKPASKAKIIEKLKSEDKQNVCYVGDGVNDVLALKSADIAIGLGSRVDISRIDADVILSNNNLLNIFYLFKLLKLTNRFIYISMFWAVIYNICCALLLASGVITLFISAPILPAISSFLMIFSDIFLLIFAAIFAFWKIKINPSKRKDK